MLHEILSFVINTVTGLLAGFLLLRFWMQVQRVRPPVALAQAIFQLTDWIVHPIRRIVPGFRGYDWASLIAVFLAAFLSMALDFWLFSRLPFVAIAVMSLFRVIQWIVYGLMALLILEAIFSWVNPHAPFAPFIRALNEPVLLPLRKILPPFGGLDFSPMVALILLQIMNRVMASLQDEVLSKVVFLS